MGFLGMRSRSKSTSYQPDAPVASSSRPHSRSSSKARIIHDDSPRAVYLTTTSAGIPIVRESSSSASSRRGYHSRSISSSSSSSIASGSSNGSSRLVPIAVSRHGAYYTPAPSMSAIVAPPHGHSPSMAYNIPAAAPYFGTQRQVVYPNGYDPSSSPSHLQSLHLDSHRGRPRSNTAREKILLSSAGAPLAGYSPGGAPTGAPSSHESSHSHHSSSQSSSSKSGGFFNFIRSRSKSKSRERDALYPGAAPDKRHRDINREREAQIMQHDVETELARRMEKDLRLQDLEDPYRTVRRDRSRSFDNGHPVDPTQLQHQQQRAREREQRRNRDLDPDVQDNTRYNATNLRFVDGAPRPSRGRSDYHIHSNGYATDVQPPMLRRLSTTAAHTHAHAHHPASAHPSSNPSRYSHQLHASRGVDVVESSASAPSLKGWYNARGDELIDKNSVICQPIDRQYSSRFKSYPAVGQGFGDSHGNIIDIHGRLLKRVG